MIAKSTTNPVFLSARKGAENAAKELGEKHGVPVQIVWMTPDNEDGQLQTTAIAQAVKDRASRVRNRILLIVAFSQHGIERRDRAAAVRTVAGTLDDVRKSHAEVLEGVRRLAGALEPDPE